MGWDVPLLWCPLNNAPYPVLGTEHKPRGTDDVGDDFAEYFWRNPVDKHPR